MTRDNKGMRGDNEGRQVNQRGTRGDTKRRRGGGRQGVRHTKVHASLK
jgi:hypothetical protein